jgi:hypothetical protein
MERVHIDGTNDRIVKESIVEAKEGKEWEVTNSYVTWIFPHSRTLFICN